MRRGSGVRSPTQVVDHVAAVGELPRRVHVGRARLGVLPGDAAELDDRHRRAVGQHDRHLQQHAHLAGDVGLRARLEGLRAVAALQQERLAARDRGQPLAQLVDLGRDDERRHAREGQRHLAQHHLVRPLRLLRGRQLAPRVEAGFGHVLRVPTDSRWLCRSSWAGDS